MPSIEVGTVGGGTNLPAQSACLEVIRLPLLYCRILSYDLLIFRILKRCLIIQDINQVPAWRLLYPGPTKELLSLLGLQKSYILYSPTCSFHKRMCLESKGAERL